MSKLSDNLQQLMSSNGLTESELARKTGLAQSVIHRIVNNITTNPGITTLSPIASFFSISISELIGDVSTVKTPTNPKVYVPGRKDAQYVPIISWREATNWQNTANNNKKHKVVITGKGITETAFGLLIVDDIDSRFAAGTILIVEPRKNPKNRDYVITQRVGENVATIKRYITEGETIYLKPIDPSLRTVLLDKEHHIIGVVVQSIFDFD